MSGKYIDSAEVKNLNEKIRVNIQRLLKVKEYTYKEAAGIINMPLETFCKKASGREHHRFNIFDLYKLADEFFITVDDIINGNF